MIRWTGIYFFASLLYVSCVLIGSFFVVKIHIHFRQCDPAHMFHSFFQYMLLAPSFVNVLNVYAFCNLHDASLALFLPFLHGCLHLVWQVSWGTKGSDKAEALPSLKSKTTVGTDAPTVEDTTNTQEDLDEAFQETVTRALTKDETGEARERPTMDDENKTFRTRLVASWMLSNAALALAISNIGGWLDIEDVHISHKQISQWLLQNAEKRNMYFTVLLYGTFFLSMVRFLGVSVVIFFSFFFFEEC